MPYLQFRDKRVTLTPADQTVGAFDGAALRLPGDDPTARALVRVAADGTGVIARAGADAVVFVNGVQLGVEPSPLLHGDKVEIAGVQLHYGDDAQGGSTQFISAASLAEKVKAASSAPKKPTGATGGRLVSLVDGREYQVPDAGVTFGREIGNDIVIASTEVSRRHAQIAPGEGGYVLSDLSTNGVLVNGVRVSQRQVLGRGDVITMGGEEFRFYADKAKEPAASAPPPAPVPAAPAPAAPARTPLATLEVINEGPMKGKMFELFTPLTNVGCGAHNDIAIADESMSDSHAKILRKDGHWYIADQGSTNGTYVGGRRVQGEQQLVGAQDVRFGNIKVTFRPTAAGQDTGGGTKAIAAVNVEQARRMSTAAKQPSGAPTPPKPADKPIKIPEASAPEKKKGCAAMIAFILALGAMGAGMVVVLLTVRG
jgi:pSer/pThr/pTyr-binding forkhead associated (FHA) protein